MVMEDYFINLRAKIGHDEMLMPGVAGVLFDESRTKVLMEKRTDAEGWGLVGGMQNLGESAVTGMVREFKEETGLDVEVVALIGIDSNFHHVFPNGDRAQIPGTIFEVNRIGGTLKADGEETASLAFVPLADNPKMYNVQHQLVIDQLIAQAPYGWFF
jgi:8-oxo-dGTP pyrophosphatase MutT (NUDIX family)